jgi:hypothetical protein
MSWTGKRCPSGRRRKARAPSLTAAARLSGRVAVVIGAARGIGRAITVELTASGADVVAADIARYSSRRLERGSRND